MHLFYYKSAINPPNLECFNQTPMLPHRAINDMQGKPDKPCG